MSVANGGEVVVGQAAEGGGGEEGNRAARLPRWSRQEILVLIQGKRVAESRVRRGRAAGGLGQGQGQVQVESKWASVSSYCKRHGVNRGPVQCRKRWSNLAGDYKKIKEWESQITREDTTESFWVMRNDLRRERKLPGFFDREVYDILDNGTSPSSSVTPTPLLFPLAPPSQPQDEDDHLNNNNNNNNNNKQDDEAVFDSGRNGLFSDFAQSAQEEAAGSPEKEFTKTLPAPVPIPIPIPIPISGATHGTQQTSNPEVGATTSHEGRKRRRFGADGDEETSTLQCQLIEVLEKNGKMLCAQLEAQNTNFQLDREQRKDHTELMPYPCFEQVFRTPEQGWAVRSRDFIPSGAPVCEYIGVLRRTDELDNVAENDYIFEIDCLHTMKEIGGRERRLGDASGPISNHLEKIDDRALDSTPEFCIDAGSVGNVARFINHSCEPNLFVQCVSSMQHDVRLARAGCLLQKK
ncbi:Trihelix transcription factor ASR3 [Camellia lanceoleosa]|uniref:Trihelix transcription factor ASR3 n=1 Tax=Camellia lanceoleosa TaxID=1840588 RepID=A0ACC0I8Y0_9ERIC|nr:Trihelix transcription factor ASR3 [Camellia lanceoleosa]